jgi:hypothetical protein
LGCGSRGRGVEHQALGSDFKPQNWQKKGKKKQAQV